MTQNNRDIESLPRVIDLAQSAALIKYDLEDGDVGHNYLLSLVSDKIVFDDFEFDGDYPDIKWVRSYLEEISGRFEESLNDLSYAYAQRRLNTREIAIIEAEMVSLKKDINKIEKNAFNGKGEEYGSTALETKTFFSEEGGDEPDLTLEVDHGKASEVPGLKKMDGKKKAKGVPLGSKDASGRTFIDYDTLSQNMVVASFSFTVKYPNGNLGNISVPIQAKGEGGDIVNLVYFRNLPQFSAEEYDDKGLLLGKLVKDRFLLGARVKGRDFFLSNERASFVDQGAKKRFAHSEQFVFAALKEDPQVREVIIDRFAQSFAGSKIGISDVEIVDMAFDMHTSRHMCSDCQVSAIGMQKDVGFLTSMKGEMEERLPGVNISDGCKVGVRASAACELSDGDVRHPVHHYHSQRSVDENVLLELDVRKNALMHSEPYYAKSVELKEKMQDHSLFTSGIWVRDQFKEAYEKATTDYASAKIVKAFREYKNRKRCDNIANDLASSAIHEAVDELASELLMPLAQSTVDSVMSKAGLKPSSEVSSLGAEPAGKVQSSGGREF